MNASLATPQIRDSLTTPIQYVKGVGPFKAQLLEKLGIRMIQDLIEHFPRDHQDRRVLPIVGAIPGRKGAVMGEILHTQVSRVGKMLGQARAVIKDNTGIAEAVWFKRLSFKYDVFSAIKRDVLIGKTLFAYGAFQKGSHTVEIHIDDYSLLESNKEPFLRESENIVPVYPLTEGVQDRWLRQLMTEVLVRHGQTLRETLPQSLLNLHGLMAAREAVLTFHFPKNFSERDRARERLAFEEFFFLELALTLNRQRRTRQTKGYQSMPTKRYLTPFRQHLRFEFTKAQSRVINQVFRDMGSPAPMNRLLQGDVGSGKTVVALSAALLAIENNRQAALLAPTEILAEQHFLSIEKSLADLSIKTALLTGSTPRSLREKILADLSSGKISLLVGTHAILEEDVKFRLLGLVVIDEQHRFGVRQRSRLMLKRQEDHLTDERLIEKVHPDVLIMTATPIPRTLALTLYGDLDVSVLDEMPPGRSPVRTVFSSEDSCFQEIDSVLAEGRQAFIVFPLVEESERLSQKTKKTIRAAKAEYEKIRARFSGRRIGLLHGQVSSEEKRNVMDAFRKGDLEILVATPVIEVGIDVPNAALIAIFNPERFGLAQLHQLRGRVGRGSSPSQCLLVISPEDVPSDRLQVFCATNDGFKLAEEDLRLRGPGEFIGEAQHGLPLFKVGDLIRDGLLIAQAREAARQIIAGELPMTYPESEALNENLRKRFGGKIHLSQVG